jgi:hypothetical protein
MSVTSSLAFLKSLIGSLLSNYPRLSAPPLRHLSTAFLTASPLSSHRGEHHNLFMSLMRKDVAGAFSQQRAEKLVDYPYVYRLFVAASQSSKAAAGRETAKRTAAVYNTSLPATAGGYIEP